jgi:hypothetical protein
MEEQVHFDRAVLEEMKRSIIFDYGDFKQPKPINTNFSLQSTDVVEETIEEHEVVCFADNAEGTSDGIEGHRDAIVENIDTSFQLGEFLKRPVRIATYSVPLGEAYNLRTLLPWHAFF